MFLVLSPDSKMVRNIKIGWKLTNWWKNWGLGWKIIPNVGLFPIVFCLFLLFFQTTEQIPRFFSVEFVVSFFLYLYLSLSLSFSISFFLYLFLSVSFSLTLFLSVSLSFTLLLSFSLFLSLSLSLFPSFSLSFFLKLFFGPKLILNVNYLGSLINYFLMAFIDLLF